MENKGAEIIINLNKDEQRIQEANDKFYERFKKLAKLEVEGVKTILDLKIESCNDIIGLEMVEAGIQQQALQIEQIRDEYIADFMRTETKPSMAAAERSAKGRIGDMLYQLEKTKIQVNILRTITNRMDAYINALERNYETFKTEAKEDKPKIGYA